MVVGDCIEGFGKVNEDDAEWFPVPLPSLNYSVKQRQILRAARGLHKTLLLGLDFTNLRVSTPEKVRNKICPIVFFFF